MTLLKGLFRKKKTITYIIIFNILFCAMFLLISFNNYYHEMYDKLMYETSSLIMISKNNHDQELQDEKLVKSYTRVLGLEINTNEFINSELNFDELIYYDNKVIAMPASSCNVSLDSNEVILAFPQHENDKDIFTNYYDKNIEFKNNGASIPLYIKDFKTPKTNPYMCISNELFKQLLDNTNNYIYSIVAQDYNAIETLKLKWDTLEDNNFYKIISSTYQGTEEANEYRYFYEIMDTLNTVNVIFLIIFVIIIIFVLKDLISDEEKDILLLKQIGFNKWQNTWVILKSFIVLDLFILILSILISMFIVFMLNWIFKFSLRLFIINLWTFLLAFILIVELFLIIIYENKNNTLC